MLHRTIKCLPGKATGGMKIFQWARIVEIASKIPQKRVDDLLGKVHGFFSHETS
jgi:hypothetical protein